LRLVNGFGIKGEGKRIKEKVKGVECDLS